MFGFFKKENPEHDVWEATALFERYRAYKAGTAEFEELFYVIASLEKAKKDVDHGLPITGLHLEAGPYLAFMSVHNHLYTLKASHPIVRELEQLLRREHMLRTERETQQLLKSLGGE